MGNRRDNIVLTALTVVACVISLWAYRAGWTSLLEAGGFITGVLAVWLTAKEHIWNWPMGLVNVGIYSYLLYQYQLWGDAWLQVVYFVLGVLGWYWWLHGGENRKEIHIEPTPRIQWLPILVISVVSTAVLTWVLDKRQDAAPFIDALTTIGSLVAQYLLTRKYIENWIVWVLMDVIYVPLYLWKGLYLTGVLYAIFTVLAYLGLRYWRGLRNQQRSLDEPVPARGAVYGMLGAGVVMTAAILIPCIRMEQEVGSARLQAVRLSEAATLTVGSNPPKEIGPELFLDLKQNATDPLRVKRVTSEGGQRIASVAFTASGAKPVVFDVYADAIRVNGKDYDRAMWEPYLGELLKP